MLCCDEKLSYIRSSTRGNCIIYGIFTAVICPVSVPAFSELFITLDIFDSFTCVPFVLLTFHVC